MVRIAGGVPVIIYTKKENQFMMTKEELEQAYTEKTKAIVLTSPSNPTGQVMSKDDLQMIADFAVSHNIFVLADEIYEKLIYDEDKQHISIASLGKEIYDRTIVINGVSKSYFKDKFYKDMLDEEDWVIVNKLALILALAESLDAPVHICHVSTYSGVRMIRDAKKAGIKVTAETCPHYYSFTDEIIRTYDTNTKVNPPIREEIDKQAILEGLKDGTLDCIVTDHAPHHADDKNVEYNLAAFGISGIETSFGFAIKYLYKAGVLSLNEIADKMSYNPAQILGLDGGEIKEGGVADLMIADLDEKWIVDPQKFVSKGKNNPYYHCDYGKNLFGIIIN